MNNKDLIIIYETLLFLIDGVMSYSGSNTEIKLQKRLNELYEMD